MVLTRLAAIPCFSFGSAEDSNIVAAGKERFMAPGISRTERNVCAQYVWCKGAVAINIEPIAKKSIAINMTYETGIRRSNQTVENANNTPVIATGDVCADVSRAL